MAIRTLRKWAKRITSNPFYALTAIGAAGTLWGMLHPSSAQRAISFLELGDEAVAGPPEMKGYTTGWGGYSGAPGYTQAIRGVPTTIMQPRKSIFGTTGGFGYDIQKKIGQFISAPLKFGKLFSESGAGYQYLFGEGDWGTLKKGLQGVLPFKVDTADVTKGAYSAWSHGFGAGPAPDRGGGGGPSYVKSRRNIAGSVGGTKADIRTSPWEVYNSRGTSANLLKEIYKNDHLLWLDRQTRLPVRSGPNISYKTSISVGGRYQRTR